MRNYVGIVNPPPPVYCRCLHHCILLWIMSHCYIVLYLDSTTVERRTTKLHIHSLLIFPLNGWKCTCLITIWYDWNESTCITETMCTRQRHRAFLKCRFQFCQFDALSTRKRFHGMQMFVSTRIPSLAASYHRLFSTRWSHYLSTSF